MNFINNWTKQIIIAVIISTILLMLVPQNKNKKYIKVVMGIYLLAVILLPITNKLNKKNSNIKDLLNIDNLNKKSKYTSLTKKMNYNSDLDGNYDYNNLNSDEIYNKYTNKNINEIYSKSLEKSMKEKLEKNDYIKKENKYRISNVEVKLDDENNIESVNVMVQYINIDDSNNNQDVSKSKNNNIYINKIENVNIKIGNNNEINNNNDNNKLTIFNIENIDDNYINQIKDTLYNEFDINKDNIFVRGE